MPSSDSTDTINPDPAAPAFKHFTIKPNLVGGLTSAQASYDSVRGRIVEHLSWLGLTIDAERNRRNEMSIAAPGATLPIWLIEANEELAILRHVHESLPHE